MWPIDVHTHVVPTDLPSLPRNAGSDWPTIVRQDCGHARILVGDKPFRDLTANAWDLRVRQDDAQAMGVGHQLLSPMPELLGYWMPHGAAQVLARHLNQTIAGMVASVPARFSGLGTVPMQDLDLAIAELRFLIEQLGLAGVEVGSNVNGTPIGAPRFAPFFEAAEALGAAIFVHPLRPVGVERLVGPAVLTPLAAFPCEIAFAALSLITGGILDTFPALRIACSHGGGALATMLPRLDQGWETIPELAGALNGPPTGYARRMFYDSMVLDSALLVLLINRFGVDRMMIGTDYPFGFYERQPLDLIATLQLSPADEAAVLHGNARRFLGHDSC